MAFARHSSIERYECLWRPALRSGYLDLSIYEPSAGLERSPFISELHYSFFQCGAP